jgi:hypothetical protein
MVMVLAPLARVDTFQDLRHQRIRDLRAAQLSPPA